MRPNLRAGFVVTLLRKAVLRDTCCLEILNSFIRICVLYMKFDETVEHVQRAWGLSSHGVHGPTSHLLLLPPWDRGSQPPTPTSGVLASAASTPQSHLGQ